MKKMKIYVAGKVAGDPNYKKKFEIAAKLVRDMGHIPLHSTFLPPGLDNGDYMRVCLALIDVSDAVYFLPDYVDSPGAKVELAYCKYVGKPCFASSNNKIDGDFSFSSMKAKETNGKQSGECSDKTEYSKSEEA